MLCRNWWVSIKCWVHWLHLSNCSLNPLLLTPYKKSVFHVPLCAYLMYICDKKQQTDLFCRQIWGGKKFIWPEIEPLFWIYRNLRKDESHVNLDAQCLGQSLVSNNWIVVRRCKKLCKMFFIMLLLFSKFGRENERFDGTEISLWWQWRTTFLTGQQQLLTAGRPCFV